MIKKVESFVNKHSKYQIETPINPIDALIKKSNEWPQLDVASYAIKFDAEREIKNHPESDVQVLNAIDNHPEELPEPKINITEEGIVYELWELLANPDQTTKNIMAVVEDLDEVEKGEYGSIGEAITIIHKALNTMHHSGSIVNDYIDDLSVEQLNYLSDISPEQEGWNKELRDIGVAV